MPLHCSKNTESSRKQLLIRKRERKKISLHSKAIRSRHGKTFFFSFSSFFPVLQDNESRQVVFARRGRGRKRRQPLLATLSPDLWHSRDLKWKSKSKPSSPIRTSPPFFFVNTPWRASFKITLCWRTAPPFTNHQLEEAACIM